MNKQLLKEWLDAARSGNYQQGIGALRYFDYHLAKHCYCFTGVLADVCVNKGLAKSKWNDGSLKFKIGEKQYCLNSCLTNNYLIEIGLFDEQEMKEHNYEFYQWVHLNDQNGLSLSQLADLVEDYFARKEAGTIQSDDGIPE